MGKAVDWQKEIEETLKDYEGIILNPRRDDWDASWVQSKDNKEFRGQVEWELYGLDNASMVVYYFEPNTKSPISLLELGMHLRSGRAIVCCPEGYEKKGNVDVTCKYYRVPMNESLDELKQSLIKIVE